MKQRSISAIGVVIVGILPAILGGPVWAIAIAVLCTLGFDEYLKMARRISPGVRPWGYLLVPLFPLAALLGGDETALLGLVALAVALPMIETTLRKDLTGAFSDWGLAAAGVLYLGIPAWAAVELRSIEGSVSANWLDRLAEGAAFGWDAFPRGLGWLVTVILITWMADTFAYLVGKYAGKHPLTPVVSPKKTVEGLVGGLVAAGITGVLCTIAFGLDVSLPIMAIAGVVLAVIALFGDLSESVLKRTAGIKDSGTLIPGHGGILDRMDALLFTFVAGLYLAMLLDRVS